MGACCVGNTHLINNDKSTTIKESDDDIQVEYERKLDIHFGEKWYEAKLRKIVIKQNQSISIQFTIPNILKDVWVKSRYVDTYETRWLPLDIGADDEIEYNKQYEFYCHRYRQQFSPCSFAELHSHSIKYEQLDPG